MPRLSTHVLDLVSGRPAQGVHITLHRLAADGARHLVASAITNADGRTDAPLMADSAFTTGTYELAFHIGGYFAARRQRGFLDIVPLRFIIDEPEGNYHVPLLASPWSYSTYRGS
ncbi:MAG: hydroxyisourate hydrolase [Hyphomicrobiales bacterium]|nr:hydroxyisourate hydrolase [Hyphomicrobiales bacterium]